MLRTSEGSAVVAVGKKGVDSEGDADDVALDVGDFVTFATDFCGGQNSSEWGCARAIKSEQSTNYQFIRN